MLRDVLTQKGLSNREAEVAELVVKGLSNKEVANQLFVTEKTVKFHLTNIYKKMNVKSRAQLIVWCMPYQSFVEQPVAGNMQPQNTMAQPYQQQNIQRPAQTTSTNQENSATSLTAGNANINFGGTTGNGTGGNDIGTGF
jgi:DNA-binding CsgD family transcriptional regulator